MFKENKYSKLLRFCEENGWKIEFNMDSQLYEVDLYPKKNIADILEV